MSLETTLSTAVSSGEDETARNNNIRSAPASAIASSGCFARSPAGRRWQAVDVWAPPQMAAAARKCQTKATEEEVAASVTDLSSVPGRPPRGRARGWRAVRGRLLSESRSTGGGGGVGKEEKIALVDVDRGLMPRTVRGHPPPGPPKPCQTLTMMWTATVTVKSEVASRSTRRFRSGASPGL